MVMDRREYEEKLDQAFEKENVVKKDRTDCENRKVIKVLKKL